MAWIIIIAITAGIMLTQKLISTTVNRGFEAGEKALARRKEAKQGDTATKLSDLYN